MRDHCARFVFTTTISTALFLGGCATERAIVIDQSSRDEVTASSPARIAGHRAMSMEAFELLKASVLFTEDDVRALRQSGVVLEPHVDELLDVWYGFVEAHDHLLYSFSSATTGEPNAEYLERVRVRFRQWVLNTATADFDQAWLNQQLEFGLRHHRLRKNQTDDVDAVAHIPLRYVIALHYPITTTLKPFLERGGHDAGDVQRMYEAWRKAVLLTTILWSQPYVTPGDF